MSLGFSVLPVLAIGNGALHHFIAIRTKNCSPIVFRSGGSKVSRIAHGSTILVSGHRWLTLMQLQRASCLTSCFPCQSIVPWISRIATKGHQVRGFHTELGVFLVAANHHLTLATHYQTFVSTTMHYQALCAVSSD